MDAYLLGAGFSKAIHEGMPVMGELGGAVLRQLDLPGSELAPFRGNVETWLSYLATPQPWDTTDIHLTNEALFLRASRAVHDVVTSANPSWNDLSETSQDLLLRLSHQWAERKAAVLTFNYDLIVEAALRREVKGYRDRDVYALPLLSRRSGAGLVVAAPVADEDRPTVYKLHGSINWLYSGTTDPHAPIVLYERTDDAHLYDDLEPVVVPPASSKSPFYGNTALRAQWRNAFEHLKTADRLVIMGYSLPATDLQVRALLGLSLKRSTEIVVVDRSPDVARQVKELLPDHEVNDQYTGFNAVDRFVDDTCDYMARWSRTGDYAQGDQHLTINGQSRTRSWTHNADSGDPTHEAVNGLARHWPSVLGRWRPEDDGARLYVSRDDYGRCPDPWQCENP